MQRAKDTFYVMLRDRIAATNAQRTVVVRGVLRPGVLVEENELPAAVAVADAFRLRWTAAAIDMQGTLPLAKLHCEIAYETAGTAEMSGMDRGRALATMDAELAAVLAGTGQSTPKMDFSAGGASPSGTRIFWSDPEFGVAEMHGERVGRTVGVEVWSLEEAGEP